MLPGGQLGTRTIVPIAEGRIEGERVRGRTLPTTADWFVDAADGLTGMLDVRAVAETDDGALVYVSYAGRTDLSGGVGSAALYGAPLFETGDAR